MAPDLDPELLEQPAGEGARRDARRRLARAGALEDVAGVVAVVLEDADEVGVPGPGAGHLAAAVLPRGRPRGP